MLLLLLLFSVDASAQPVLPKFMGGEITVVDPGWNDSTISDAQIFVTADYVWGPDEGHIFEHRYIISLYVRKPSTMIDGLYYYLEDRYMTIRKYDLDANADILNSEKLEILARLHRIKAESK